MPRRQRTEAAANLRVVSEISKIEKEGTRG